MGHLHGRGRRTGQIWTWKKKKPGEGGFRSGQDKQKIKKVSEYSQMAVLVGHRGTKLQGERKL